VSDKSTGTPPDLNNVWADLGCQGYALTNDRAVGLSERIREHFRETYFNDHTLRRDDGDKPANRRRARDVIRYQWRNSGLEVREHETITITNRGDMAGKRDHARVRILDDPLGEDLVRALLALVPPDRREPDSTFGVNLFRTFTDVVTRPHRDHEPFCVFYVLNRVGGGAETYLYRTDAGPDHDQPTAEPTLRHQLNPGDIIIFEDRLFEHGATPLEPPTGGSAVRDALICTVDNPETYLCSATVS
jgi:2OG-Fe dioxygenase